MSERLKTRLGQLALKNPVMAGSGEATMTAAGIRAAIQAGAGAVMAKSTNEAEAAKKQLNHTDYMLLDGRWNAIPWSDNPPVEAQLFCRSGLQPENFDTWLGQLAELDREAATVNSYVVGHLILNDVEQCARMAERMQEAGLRAINVLVAAVHGDQAAKGAIAMVRDPDGVREVVSTLRKRIKVPLWIKLPGHDVAILAAAARDGGADAVNFIDRTLAMVPDLKTRAPHLGTIAALGGSWGLPIACRWLAETRKRLGSDYPMIGTNGVRDGYDVARMLLSGARAVEMTTAVMLHGSQAIAQAIAELDQYLSENDLSVEQIIGEAADKLTAYTDQESRPGHWRNFIHEEAR